MKILIADDEPLARKRVLKLLQEAEPLAEIKTASSGKETLDLINEFNPELLFLDIQMTDMTGFEVIQEIENALLPIIVFVTAYDHFAVQAFEVQAIDFLLKPYKSSRFFEALQRGVEKVQQKNQAVEAKKIESLFLALKEAGDPLTINSISYLRKIVLKVNKRYKFLEVSDIKYIISSAYYAEIFTQKNQKHLYRISLTDLIQKLDPAVFIRINRSVIIKISEIAEVVSEGQGDYTIIMNDRKSFSLTKNFRNPFLIAMEIK